MNRRGNDKLQTRRTHGKRWKEMELNEANRASRLFDAHGLDGYRCEWEGRRNEEPMGVLHR